MPAIVFAAVFVVGGWGSALEDPQWIWFSAEGLEDDRVVLRKSFELDASVERAILFAACDNHFDLHVNGGEEIAGGDEWTQPLSIDVTSALVEGKNVLDLWCRNDGGPAGLVAWLEIDLKGGGEQRFVSDESWLATRDLPEEWGAAIEASATWMPAHVLGALGSDPWGALAEPRPYAKAMALGAEAIETPVGFEAELLYSVPRASEGSWVSLCEDDRGRLYASDQGEGLYRITPPPIGGSRDALRVERVDVELAGAQGLLWAFDALYVVVNAGGGRSGLYRLSDTNGDDQLDHVERLSVFDGSGEHGPHAVRLAPDGETLYVIGGNHTALPEGCEDRPWGEDQLLPRLGDPGGHAVGVLAPGGWLCTTDREGRDYELVCWGMRNAYDFDFAPNGDVLTYDSDMEWDVGMPWYRPTRVLHLVPQGEYGWRNGSGKWPASYPDSLPAAVDIGLGSPTGVEFGTRAAFPKKWRDAFYVLDWTYGTIYAVHLEREGASWSGEFEAFVRGKPLPVTDVVIARDGAMYFTTGGRGTQSGLYRVTWKAGIDAEGASEEVAVAREEPRDLLGIWPRLDDPDRFRRFAARTRLEELAPKSWRERLEREARPRALVEGCVALARVGEPTDFELLLVKLGELPWEDLTDATRIGMLRALGLGCVRLREPTREERMRLLERLDPRFPSGGEELDRELARVLVYLAAPAFVPRALRAMREAESQENGLHYAFMLREAKDDWTFGERRAYFRWLDEVAVNFRGGASLAKYLDGLRAEAWQELNDEERAIVEAERPPVEEQVVPSLDLVGRKLTQWSAEDLARDPAELRLGRSFATGRAAFAATTCLTCHRIAGEGGSTGPDLTGAGARFSTRDLLETILEPSKVVSDQYRDTEVRLFDGELIVGRLLEEHAERIVLLSMPPAEEQLTVTRDEIESIRPHPLSRMPEGLIDALTREEALDLLAYVLAGGDPEDPAFGER